MISTPPNSLSISTDDTIGLLRAAVSFKAFTGKTPKRRDFRDPDRTAWERELGIPLPTDRQVRTAFGSWGNYISAAGLDRGLYRQVEDSELAAIEHVHQIYPNFVTVMAEANAYDGYLDDEKVEVKGSSLQSRVMSGSPVLFFNFKLHGRDYTKIIDRMVFVGLGHDPETQELVPMVRLEFPKSSLGIVSNKTAAMIYASSIWGTGNSIYRPYIAWRLPVTERNAANYLKNESSESSDFGESYD